MKPKPMRFEQVLTYLILLGVFVSCQNGKTKTEEKPVQINYDKTEVLDSLYNQLSFSQDTIFLGLRLGMSKKQFEMRINELRNQGQIITFSKSNSWNTMLGRFELGAGYTYKTNIAKELNGTTITGTGSYFIQPNYNSDGILRELNILPSEEWEGNRRFDSQKWLESKIKDSYSEVKDKGFTKALRSKDIISEYGFFREKGNCVVYDNDLIIFYSDRKSLVLKLLLKKAEEEIAKEDSKKVKV